MNHSPDNKLFLYNPATMNAAQLPHIGINAHLLAAEAGYRRAGIHQYIAQVLRHLPTTDLRYTVYTQFGGDFLQRPNVTAVATRWPTASRLARIAWEQTAWPWRLRQDEVDLVHGMAFATPLLSKRPSVVTVYDLSFMHYPHTFPAMQRRYLTWMTRLACQRARRIITISDSSRQDVHRFFGVPLARIDVVLPGVDSVYQPLAAADVAAFRHEQGLDGRIILHVGTLQPRKNIPVLIDAVAQLNDPTVKLVLVGGKGWLYDEIFARVTALGLQQQVLFTGYVPDEALPLWYNAADLFVLPSLYEGFGMPAVEAMACGTPVIVADSSSLPEAVGTAGLRFAPQSASALAECIGSVLFNSAMSAKMRRLGVQQAQHFSWEHAARETAVVYQKALQQI